MRFCVFGCELLGGRWLRGVLIGLVTGRWVDAPGLGVSGPAAGGQGLDVGS